MFTLPYRGFASASPGRCARACRLRESSGPTQTEARRGMADVAAPSRTLGRLSVLDLIGTLGHEGLHRGFPAQAQHVDVMPASLHDTKYPNHFEILLTYELGISKPSSEKQSQITRRSKQRHIQIRLVLNWFERDHQLVFSLTYVVCLFVMCSHLFMICMRISFMYK